MYMYILHSSYLCYVDSATVYTVLYVMSGTKCHICLPVLLCRRRMEESLEENKHRAHLEQRMKALISLKNNIDSNQVQVEWWT